MIKKIAIISLVLLLSTVGSLTYMTYVTEEEMQIAITEYAKNLTLVEQTWLQKSKVDKVEFLGVKGKCILKVPSLDVLRSNVTNSAELLEKLKASSNSKNLIESNIITQIVNASVYDKYEIEYTKSGDVLNVVGLDKALKELNSEVSSIIDEVYMDKGAAVDLTEVRTVGCDETFIVTIKGQKVAITITEILKNAEALTAVRQLDATNNFSTAYSVVPVLIKMNCVLLSEKSVDIASELCSVTNLGEITAISEGSVSGLDTKSSIIDDTVQLTDFVLVPYGGYLIWYSPSEKEVVKINY